MDPTPISMRQVAIGFVLAIAIVGQFALPSIGVNAGSRWNTAFNLVHEGTYEWVVRPIRSIDMLYLRDEAGKMRPYSSKPAFLPTIMAAIYLPLSAIGLPFDDPVYRKVVVRIVLWLINLLPFGVFLVLFGRYLAANFSRIQTICISFFCAMTCTYLTGYLLTINNHLLAALSVFFATFLLWQAEYLFEKRRRMALLGAGAWAALGVGFEFTSMIFAGWALIFLARFRGPRVALPFLGGFLVAFALVCITELVATGYLFPHPVRTKFGLYASGAMKMHSYWSNPGGNDALDQPKWLYGFHALFGHHGFFSMTPILLIVPFATKTLVRDWASPVFLVACVALVCSLTLMPVVVFATSNYGGACQGMRWLFWLIPLWLFVLPFGVEYVLSREWGVAFLAIVITISLYSVYTCIDSPWGISKLEQFFRSRW